MNLKTSFEFLIDLRFNNNRNWFNENKDRYVEAKAEFDSLIDAIIPRLKTIDPSITVTSSKECVFRIYRDVRFSKNKEPYKINFGALMGNGGKKSPFAGYYLHFQPDGSFVGGGIYQPDGPTIKALREGIYSNVDEFKALINKPEFKKLFPEIHGEKLKTAPKGFPKDFADIELLKHKHYAVLHDMPNEDWFKDDVVEKILDVYKVQSGYNRFLNRLLEH
ncbi:MAG: DUF2461 domain-containing protein [Bacteroidales bacterium]|nr:DUF2461 domain-containing protein [Bacteroidales bacterium]